jgi:hypothetical protein
VGIDAIRCVKNCQDSTAILAQEVVISAAASSVQSFRAMIAQVPVKEFQITAKY